jgi:hypothetical protein
MKTDGVLFPVAIGVTVFTMGMMTSCAGGPTAASSSSPAPSPAVVEAGTMEVAESDDVTVDWQGRNVGVGLPSWIQLIASQDPNNDLKNLPRLKDKKPIPMTQEGLNLPILEAWVDTQAYTQCGQKIRTAVSAQAQNATDGSLQSAAVTIANRFGSLYSQATITGLGKEMSGWVKTRSKKSGAEKFTYYVVYSISDADLQASINETFGKVEARTREEEDVKVKLEDQMNQLLENIRF